MRNYSIFRTILYADELVEVEVDAYVYFGSTYGGGDDPSIVENTSVWRLETSTDISDELPPELIERLENELYESAYSSLGDDE